MGARSTYRSTSSTRSDPVDVNGINKMAGEWYHLLYGDVYGLRVSVAAPDQHVRAAHAREGCPADVPRLSGSRLLVSRSASDVFGDGEQRRDLNYVDDAVARVSACGYTRRSSGQVYNLGDADRRSASHELAAAAGRAQRDGGYRSSSRSRPTGRRSTSATTGRTTARSSASLAGDRRWTLATASRHTRVTTANTEPATTGTTPPEHPVQRPLASDPARYRDELLERCCAAFWTAGASSSVRNSSGSRKPLPRIAVRDSRSVSPPERMPSRSHSRPSGGCRATR